MRSDQMKVPGNIYNKKGKLIVYNKSRCPMKWLHEYLVSYVRISMLWCLIKSLFKIPRIIVYAMLEISTHMAEFEIERTAFQVRNRKEK